MDSRFFSRAAASAALMGIAASAFAGGEVEWIGGNGNWSSGPNWGSGASPATDDIAVLEGQDQNGVILLDGSQSILGLRSRNPIAGRTDNYTHTIDLNNYTLEVTGHLHQQQYYNVPDAGRDSNHGDNYLTISNGTFRLGTEGAPAEFIIGQSWDDWYAGHMTFGPGTIFDGHIGQMMIGRGKGGWACVDFRDAAEIRCGSESGVFRAQELDLGYEGNGAVFRSNIEILFGSALKSFEIQNALRIAWNEQNTSWIGSKNGYGTAPIPDGTDVKFGVDSNSRALVSIGEAGYWPTSGQFASGAGGDCTAWISSLALGIKASGGGGTSFGALELADMDSVSMDVSGNTRIGISFDAGHVGTGRLALPAGTASFNTVTVGSEYGWGELLLNGTAAPINGSLSIGKCGVVSNVVEGASCGLDFDSGTSFANIGKVFIVFARPDASEGANGPYWGLRMKGDHSVALAQMLNAGYIAIDDTQIPGTANIYYDADTDYTYIAHRADGRWAPTVVTKALAIELDPDVATTIVLDISDVDLSPAQEGISANFTGPTDLTPSNPSVVTLPQMALGATDVPIVISNTLTYSSAELGSTTVPAELTVTPLLPRSTSQLTWAGAASLTYMDRPDWRWSANWLPATGAPADVTPASLLFNDTSLATNRVDRDRTVGGIIVANSSGKHVFDLDGSTLTVTNLAYTADTSAAMFNTLVSMWHDPELAASLDGSFAVGSKDRVSHALVKDGTLAFAKGDLLMDSTGADWSTLVVTNSAIDADIGTLRLSSSDRGGTGYSRLDLRGSTVKDGVFKAENFVVGYGMCETQGRSAGEFIFDADTGIDEFVALRSFCVGWGHRSGTSRMGDPNNGWKLPAEVSFKLGASADDRAACYVGWCNWGGDSALLEASSGGKFEGWLNELVVGRGMPGYLRLAAMDSIDVDATSIILSANGNSGSNGTELTLPPGGVRCDDFTAAGNGTAYVALNGTTLQIDNSIAIGGGTFTVDTHINGKSCGLRFGESVAPEFDANTKINLHFDAFPAARPCAGLCFEGDRADEIQALLDAGTVTVDAADGVDISRVKIYQFKGDTYLGYPLIGGTMIMLK